MRKFCTVIALSFSLTHFTEAQDVVTTIIRTASPVTITSNPSSTPPSPQYTDSSALQSAVLNSTNTYRRQHNASALTWNDTLASYAKSHAGPCKFAHSGGPHGENLAQGYPDITSAIDAWGEERSKYDFDASQFGEGTGHFTQLVWKNTTSTGCGVKNCDDTGWLLFCEYSPAGNVIGQFKQEVQKQLPADEATESAPEKAPESSEASQDESLGGFRGGAWFGFAIAAILGAF